MKNEQGVPDLLEGDLNDTEEHRRAIYALFKAGDARFDGRVFVGVSSTGIYCRTVCHVHMPKFENCTFFHSAAQAEAAGFRPCMVCRPELAPGYADVDARENLARRAATFLREQCSTGASVEELSSKLGYTSRHVRRVFEERYGVTVAMVNGRVVENRLEDVAGKSRNIPESCDLLTVARRMGISLG